MYKEELNEIKANLTAVSQELEVARKQLEEVCHFVSVRFLNVSK